MDFACFIGWFEQDVGGSKAVNDEDPEQGPMKVSPPPPPHDCKRDGHEWGWHGRCIFCNEHKSSSETPLPCPKCGAQPRVLREYKKNGQAYVACGCERSKFGPKRDGEAAAIAAWNQQCREKEVGPLPCPTCGSEARVGTELISVQYPDGRIARAWHVKCGKCAVLGLPKGERIDAIAAWNRQCRENELGPVYPGWRPGTLPCPKCRTRSLPNTKYVGSTLEHSCQLWCISEDCDYRSPAKPTELEAEQAWNRESVGESEGGTITNLRIEGGTLLYADPETIAKRMQACCCTMDEANHCDEEWYKRIPRKKSRLRRWWKRRKGGWGLWRLGRKQDAQVRADNRRKAEFRQRCELWDTREKVAALDDALGDVQAGGTVMRREQPTKRAMRRACKIVTPRSIKKAKRKGWVPD